MATTASAIPSSFRGVGASPSTAIPIIELVTRNIPKIGVTTLTGPRANAR